MHDYCWNVSNAIHVFNQIIVSVEETVVHEVVTLDTRQSGRQLRLTEFINELLIRKKLQRTRIPNRPRLRSFETYRGIVARQPPVIRIDHIAALGFGNDANVLFPRLGKDRAGALAVFVEPANLFWPAEKNHTEHERTHSVRMGLSIREREGAAPRATKYLPLFDTEMFADSLDIFDEMPGRVVVERSVRLASTSTALIEQNHTISFRIEEAAVVRKQTRAGAAVQKQNRLPFRIAALLVIEFVNS